MSQNTKKTLRIVGKILVYAVCILLAILSIYPFWIMLVNATRSTTQIQQSAIAFIPSNHIARNFEILKQKETFNAFLGFKNSIIISTLATACSVYFSTLTAYAVVVYDWKLKHAFFTFIMAVMMIPGQIMTVGFYQRFTRLVGLTVTFR